MRHHLLLLACFQMERSQTSSNKSARPKSLIYKMLQRCRSLTCFTGPRNAISPVGWVSVRVGPAKEKFLVRAEWMNHRLFRRLLDEAETAYGYATDGPLELPCSVELFHLVLWELDQDEADSVAASPSFCGYAASPARWSRGVPPQRYRLISPSRVAAVSLF